MFFLFLVFFFHSTWVRAEADSLVLVAGIQQFNCIEWLCFSRWNMIFQQTLKSYMATPFRTNIVQKWRFICCRFFKGQYRKWADFVSWKSRRGCCGRERGNEKEHHEMKDLRGRMREWYKGWKTNRYIHLLKLAC